MLIKTVRRIAHGMRDFRNWRIRVPLAAGRPDWNLRHHLTRLLLRPRPYPKLPIGVHYCVNGVRFRWLVTVLSCPWLLPHIAGISAGYQLTVFERTLPAVAQWPGPSPE